jgi:hypothetical protein
MSLSSTFLKGFVCGVALVALGSAARGQENDPYVAVLARESVEPELPGMVGYLRGLKPSEADRARISSLVMQLGSRDFVRREGAMRELIALPVVPVEELRAAVDGADQEARLRAMQVMSARSVGNNTSAAAVACFRIIAKRKLAGAAPVVLDVLPLYGEEFVLGAARDALKATCRAEDAGLLRRAIRAGGGAAESRAAAVTALAAVAGEAAMGEIAGLVDDAEPRVSLAAARVLADRGERATLPALVRLLSSADVRVRQGSIATLRALTGRSSDYAAWVDPEVQVAAIDGWRKWLAGEGKTAALHYPLRPTDYEVGRTLICLYAKNEIVELDAQGHQTLSISEPGGCPWACQGLANGNRLVALYSTNQIVEYRGDGKERVRIPVPGGPMSVQRLENGNTLVACNNAQKVVEVDDSGKVLWEIALTGGPCDATRLENGNTLVVLQNSNAVIEFDPSGHEIWKVEKLHTPRSATRLENGDTLVCDLGTGKVVEFDRDGREVWSQEGFSSPFGAQRLASGTTLISDTEGVKEVDASGKVVSETRMSSSGRVARY